MSALYRVLQSVLAALIGVQSEKKRQEDFQHSSPWPFIIAGIILTLMLVLLLVILVRWISH